MDDMRLVKIVPHGRLKSESEAIEIAAYDALQAVTGLMRNFPKIEPMLRGGKFRLHASGGASGGDNDSAGGKSGRDLTGRDLTLPLDCARLDLIPMARGAARGKGKAILGLTLIGLSFVPSVNAGVAQGFSSLGGNFGASSAAAFQSFGTNFLGRAGGLLLLSGLAEMASPQVASPAGQMPSATLPVPNVDGQGAAIPLAYGRANIIQPVMIASAFNVDTIR